MSKGRCRATSIYVGGRRYNFENNSVFVYNPGTFSWEKVKHRNQIKEIHNRTGLQPVVACSSRKHQTFRELVQEQEAQNYNDFNIESTKVKGKAVKNNSEPYQTSFEKTLATHTSKNASDEEIDKVYRSAVEYITKRQTNTQNLFSSKQAEKFRKLVKKAVTEEPGKDFELRETVVLLAELQHRLVSPRVREQLEEMVLQTGDFNEKNQNRNRVPSLQGILGSEGHMGMLEALVNGMDEPDLLAYVTLRTDPDRYGELLLKNYSGTLLGLPEQIDRHQVQYRNSRLLGEKTVPGGSMSGFFFDIAAFYADGGEPLRKLVEEKWGGKDAFDLFFEVDPETMSVKGEGVTQLVEIAETLSKSKYLSRKELLSIAKLNTLEGNLQNSDAETLMKACAKATLTFMETAWREESRLVDLDSEQVLELCRRNIFLNPYVSQQEIEEGLEKLGNFDYMRLDYKYEPRYLETVQLGRERKDGETTPLPKANTELNNHSLIKPDLDTEAQIEYFATMVERIEYEVAVFGNKHMWGLWAEHESKTGTLHPSEMGQYPYSRALYNSWITFRETLKETEHVKHEGYSRVENFVENLRNHARLGAEEAGRDLLYAQFRVEIGPESLEKEPV